MKLLTEEKLIWSPIVVNSRMNRTRNSSGVNSYEQELGFKPEAYIETIINKTGSASWLDLCCGEGKALFQTAQYLKNKGLQDSVTLLGIDLIDTFPEIDKSINCLELRAHSIINWTPDQAYDLITCVHGLHYIGDKLKLVQTCLKALKPSGIFVADLDLDNIVIREKNSSFFLRSKFKESGLSYNARTRRLKQQGKADIDFQLTYLGASDEHGPNYTGQDSVASYYSV